MQLENERLIKIINLIINEDNMHTLLLNNYSKIYGIVQKKGNLKDIFTANINSKLRLYMRPCGEHPYNYLEILSIELVKIDDKHYGDG